MLKRLGRVLWFILQPLPHWSDAVGRITPYVSLVGILFPTLRPLYDKYAAQQHHWTVMQGVIFSCAAFGLLALFGAYRLQMQVDSEHDSMPRLVQCGTSDMRTNVGADFYHLRVANEPKGIAGRETAKRLAGTVQICDENEIPLGPERIHRWAASAQIPGYPSKADLDLAIDIDPNGIPHLFDIALKFQEDAEFYTHNNQSVAQQGYRDPQFRFGPGTYIAVIKIKGSNANATFRCRIVNPGMNRKLTVTPMS
jgi:hypothetical protein